MELAKAYDPKEAEESHYKRWEESGFFAPEINKDADATKYSIVIPPPNVTGSLHMGHALQHTLMDVLTRWKRMQGYRTLWLPGTDHAGISVQRKVVEQLKKDEHKSPLDIGREEFVRRAWKWKEEYGNTIIEQMRREGASVDWSRHRFTMDESLSLAVRNVFCTLYDEGNIYRGLRIVNWCPKDKTVLSDLEVKDEIKKDGKLYYLKYPVKGTPPYEGGVAAASADGVVHYLTVATTRPETMLGDTAVAVNPSDDRYKDLIGKTIALPLTNREIPIIADEYVDAEFGTGAVKVTPAHDPNDYQIGERHSLPQLLVMNMDATMNADAGPDFEGLDRFVAREKVVERFDELGLLEKVYDYEITLPVCERCKTIVEPILSEQWFVKMDEMRDLALEMARNEGVPHFSPEVPHQKVYTTWLENLKDWTISRQLWWGHQIPAWYDSDGNVFVAPTEAEALAKAGGRELAQDSDVLDTWFSSGLWAFSTFGWNGDVTETDDLATFLPTDVLVTGRDIIFLWVSRMMMLTKKFTGKKAFEDCVITGTVLGKDGKPMSKSRNNGVDPIEMFDKFGVDATRIYLASIATGADIKWNDVGVETYRNFANKIWNATRFCLMNAEGAAVDVNQLRNTHSIADRWIVSRLTKTAIGVNASLGNYHFYEAVRLLYQFFWNDFCDWYIELVKDEIAVQQGQHRSQSDVVQFHVEAINLSANTRVLTILEQALRMLHPFMPYLTEELWQKLPGTSPELHNSAYSHAKKSIMLADFPTGDFNLIDEQAETEMWLVINLIKVVRDIRARLKISANIKFKLFVSAKPDAQEIYRANENQILKLARAETLKLDTSFEMPTACAKGVLLDEGQVAIPLEGILDFDKERERLQTQIAKLTEEKSRLDAQLANNNFVDRAPAEKVDALRERASELGVQIATMNTNLEALSD